MILSTEDAVRETYRIALEENLKKALKTPEEFARFREITKEAAERLDAENDGFREGYQDRLVKAEEVVMREAAGRFLDHPKPSWAEDTMMSGDRIEILAHNRVLEDHETRKLLIRTDQIDAYKALHNDCRERARLERAQSAEQSAQSRAERKGRAQDAFNLTNQVSPHEAQTRGRSGPSRS
ncbi:MAG: hypothetical protein AAGG79_07745 [Pseudomonadota bacterium]